jgi:phenylpropionate dioxygenase-like ring-hydroxylating dioxygenase large terminal subunit
MASPVIATDTQPWYDVERGVLDRRVFADREIYELELARIFARGWNFICHESQLPEAGSFFTSYIGEDQVIAVRDRAGQVQVLLNSCPHRGNTVCRAEQGRTASFFCSYHGWNFDLDGRLVGMPGEDTFYRNDIDKAAWGLAKAAQVASYRGFVFATLDPAAPALPDYLGWVGRLGLDKLASQGDLVVVDGIQKNRIRCNWKLAVDNLYDWYHVQVSHGSALKVNALGNPESLAPMSQMVILGEYGHGIGGPGISEAQMADLQARLGAGEHWSQWYDQQAQRQSSARVQAELGPVGSRSLGHPNIFPNLWVALTWQVCLRIPRGPHETELWWFTLLPKDMPAAERRQAMFIAGHLFGPSGLLEQDDGENWSHSTRGAAGPYTRSLPVNFAMGKGHDRVTSHEASGQSAIETVVNEHGQRWTYQCWQEWMRAASWEELRAIHSQPPTGVV